MRAAIVKFKCDNCQSDVEQKEALYKRAKNHYCSLKCSARHRASKRPKVFTRKFTNEIPITQAELMELFDYSKDSGEFKVKVKYNTMYNVGDSPKTKNKDGYYQLRINGKMYIQHRLAWLYCYGEFPTGDLDHINHIKTDNRISNLRVVDKSENNRNLPKRSDNTSGINGVWWHKDTKKWIAEGMFDGKKHYIGCFSDIEYAAIARKEFDMEFNFHENHGK